MSDLTNESLLAEVISSKHAGVISPELGRMLIELVTRLANKPMYHHFTDRDDMINDAVANLCRNALKFKPELSDNPFAFYTTCAIGSFIAYIAREKKAKLDPELMRQFDQELQ